MEYGEDLMEPELRLEYIEKIKRIEKESRVGLKWLGLISQAKT